MRVLHAIQELSGIPGPMFLAIGVFDGVHPGHRAVIARALQGAREHAGTAVAVTFEPHPVRVLRPEHAPRSLTALAHKSRLIEALDVDVLLVIPFTRDFAATPPEEFIRQLAEASNSLREICVGHSWSFGKGRAGNLQLLEKLGPKFGFSEVGIPAVKVDGEIVSSTLIRSAVEQGDLARAARLLGREYTVLGTVVEGNHLGQTLGFPTANLAAHNEQFPPSGVYAVEVFHGRTRLEGAANIGTRPTIQPDGRKRLLEVHLFDFDGDLYGEELEVAFRQFIRPEQEFPGLEALKDQINRDIQVARRALALRS